MRLDGGILVTTKGIWIGMHKKQKGIPFLLNKKECIECRKQKKKIK